MFENNTLNFFFETLKNECEKYNIDPNTVEVVSCGTAMKNDKWYFTVLVKHDSIESCLLIPSYKEDIENKE